VKAINPSLCQIPSFVLPMTYRNRPPLIMQHIAIRKNPATVGTRLLEFNQADAEEKLTTEVT